MVAMSVETPMEPGLRERKRRATRRAIQLAALRLAADAGLEGVTVDAISRAADVSPRTFFNYFATKEEAVLGDSPELPDDEAVEAFVAADGPMFDDLIVLLAAAWDPTAEDAELIALRHRLVRQHPHLLGLRIASMRRLEDAVAVVMERRLHRQRPDEDRAALAEEARLATLVAFGVMRHAWARWWAGAPDGGDLAELLRRSFAQASRMLEAGVARIR
jgi:AcrR family transcriptional regulator